MTKRHVESGYLYVPYEYLRKNKNSLFAIRFRLYKKKECERRRRYRTNNIKPANHLDLVREKHRCSFCRGLYWKVAYYRGYMLCLYCFQKKEVISFILFSDNSHEISTSQVSEIQMNMMIASSSSSSKMAATSLSNSSSSTIDGEERNHNVDEKNALMTLAQFHLSRDGHGHYYYQHHHLLPPFYISSSSSSIDDKKEKEEESSSSSVAVNNEPILFHITSARELPSLTTMLLPPPSSLPSSPLEEVEDDHDHHHPGITVDILPTYDSDYWTRRALSLFL